MSEEAVAAMIRAALKEERAKAVDLLAGMLEANVPCFFKVLYKTHLEGALTQLRAWRDGA